VSWNAGAEDIFGYREAEVIGRDIEFIYEQNDREAMVPTHERNVATKEGRADDDRWHRAKDGRRIYCSGVLTPIEDASFTGFAKIVRDLTGRKLREEANREALLKEQAAREQALSSSQLKDEFIAVLSHELKHPLNLIGVKAEILPRLPETRDIPAVRDASSSIRQAIRSQAQIIDDLLDWSRVQTGKLSLNVTRVDLTQVLTAVADTVEQDAHSRGIAIVTDIPAAPAIIHADATRCEQITWNLVSNALKFTDSGGRIELRLTQEGRMHRIDVVDSGQGIETGTLPFIFDMFRQGALGRSRTGLGIGLALVKQLVEMQGGRVHAYSAGLGHGTTVSVWLPKAVDERAEQERQNGSGSSIAGLRILLVEDDRQAAASLGTLLELEGASVVRAATGPQALEVGQDQVIDIVLSDISLPGMDGYELMKRMRADSRWASVAAIAFTGHTREEDVQAAKDAGFDAHLPKPLDISQLLETLAALAGVSGSPTAKR
jgi:two-component system CheB/CheR fusion protein